MLVYVCNCPYMPDRCRCAPLLGSSAGAAAGGGASALSWGPWKSRTCIVVVGQTPRTVEKA